MDSSPGRRRRAVVLVALVAVALAAVSIRLLAQGDDETSSTASPVVLVISVDGLNPEALTILGRAEAPSFHRLITEGASTLNARTALEMTTTLPNHTGMLTGRGVAGGSGHSVTFNRDNGVTLRDTHRSYVPGVFDVAHDAGLQTAFFAEKDKFGYLLRSWDDTHGARDEIGQDGGRDKTDVQDLDRAAAIAPQVRSALVGGDTDMIFWHTTAPDTAGHATGWLSPTYLAAVRAVDDKLDSVLRTVDTDPALRDRLTILLTADHGGARGLTHHDDADRLANHRIPFIAWGRGVARGADLYELSDRRKDPRDGRPDYSGAQPVRNIDLANTALSVLGLPAIDDARSSSWPPLRLR